MATSKRAIAERITRQILDLAGMAAPIVIAWLVVDTIMRPIRVSSDSRLEVRERAMTAIVEQRIINAHMLIASSLILRAMIDVSFLTDQTIAKYGAEDALVDVTPRVIAWGIVLALFQYNLILIDWLLKLSARRVIQPRPRLVIGLYLLLSLFIAGPAADIASSI